MRVICLLFTIIALAGLVMPASAWSIGDWTTPVNISNSLNYWSVEANMAFDSSGNVHMVYEDWVGSTSWLKYTNNTSGSFFTGQNIIAGDISEMRLVITPDQVMHIVYRQDGHSIYYTYKPVSGGSWSTPQDIKPSWTDGDTWIGDFGADELGNLFVAFLHLWDEDTEPNSALWGRYKPVGGSWGSTELIAYRGWDDWPSDSRVFGHEDKIYVTYSCHGAKYRVRYPNGAWSSEIFVESGGGTRLAFAPNGEMVCAYGRDVDGDANEYWFEVFVKYSYDMGATWGSEINVSNHHNLDRSPEVCYDSNNNMHLTYQRFANSYSQPEIWMVHRDASWNWYNYNLTNTAGRTGAPPKSIQAYGGDLHFVYNDNTNPPITSGMEEVYYKMRPGYTDPTPPGAPTGFTATAGENRINLNWNNPSDSDFQGTIVRASTSGYPTGPHDGYYITFGGGSAGSAQSHLVYPLTAGVPHYFSIFARDYANNWSVAAHATATPQYDTTPPASVTSFTAEPYTSENIILQWQNPSDIDFKGTKVVYKTTGFPTSPTDGTVACDKTNTPGTSDSFLHENLDPTLTYYYAAFAYDYEASPNYAAAATDSAQPDYISIAEVRNMPNGRLVTLNNVYVTGIFSFDGSVYVQEPDRNAGIRLVHSGNGLAVGDKVTVTGYTGTRTSGALEREITSPVVSVISSGHTLEPLYMRNIDVGGAAIPPYIEGVQDANGELGVGLNNIGLLCRVSGVVTDKVSVFLFIDDGSEVPELVGRTGIPVRFPGPYAPANEGDYVVCTGVVAANMPLGYSQNRRIVYARSYDDVQAYAINGNISGTVKNHWNEPIDGASVFTSAGGYSTTTNSSGSYTLSQVLEGTYDVTASASGYSDETQTGVSVTAGNTTTCNLVMDSGKGRIAGYVKDTLNNPISGATVSTNTGGYSTTTLTDGSYTIYSVDPGTYTVTASATGYSDASQSGVSVTADSTTTVNLNLQTTLGWIEGYVKDTSGNPISGASVSTNSGGYSTTSGTDGSYTLSQVEPGTYSVTASKSGYNSQTQTGVSVTEAAGTTCNFNLSPLPGTITGYVRDTSSSPISGATVSTNSGGYSTTTASNGSYTITGVTPGSYQVTASKTNYTSQTNGVTVTPGGTTTSNFYLPPLPGTITGIVWDNSGARVAGATVSTNTGGYSTSSTSDGSYTLSNVTPGTYTVTAQKTGYFPDSASVTVYTNQTTNQDLTITYDPSHECVTNGNFEGGFFSFWGGTVGNNWGACWTSDPFEDASWDDEYVGAPHGFVQNITGKKNGWGAGIIQVVSGLTPGASYTLSAEAYRTYDNYSVWIQAYHGSGSNIIPGPGTAIPVVTNQWRTASVSGTVPAGGTITVYVWAQREWGSSYPVYIDNISLMSW